VPGLTPSGALLPAAAAALLLLAALLSLYDAWQNIVTYAEKPILSSSWAWLVFDVLLPLLGLLLLRALMERDAALGRLARQAVTDPLTGLRNRRGFLAESATALARCARAGQEVAVVMIDLDRFKSINDVHGHAAGDAVLRATAEAVAAGLRAGDLPGRLGGEEFALLLPDADLDAAAATAERLRTALTAAVQHPGGARVTASFGVARVGEEGLDAALAAADAALYRAKQGGRDRVVVAGAAVPALEGAAA
jgi:diguanylate cyclase (GGDEF)-like protein